MTDEPLHRAYLHFQELPSSTRVLFTAALLVLSTGYLFALLYLYESHSGRDGKPGLSVNDVVIAYSGSKESTRLESALRGPMASMLPANEANHLITWIHGGLEKAKFGPEIAQIMEKRCLACHDGSNPHIPNLITYDDLVEVAQLDEGVDIFTLVRVSHIHLFGLTFIFFITGLIFSHAYVRPVWLKCLIIAFPFVQILLDIFSWYLTKISEPFAYVIVISGGLMGGCFAFMWVVSMYQMWFYKPSEIFAARAAERRAVG